MTATSQPTWREGRKGRRLLVPGAVLLAVLAGAIGWAIHRWATAPAPPPLALDGVDPEVAEALRAAHEAVVDQSRSAAAWGRLGMTLFAHDFHSEALTCLAQAEALDPRDVRWPYYQGMIHRLGDADEALACLRRAAGRAGNGISPRLRLAELLLELEREEAGEDFRRVLERHRANPRAELGLGLLACRRGDVRDGIPHLTRAASSAYARRAAHAALAQAHQRMGDEAAADRERRVADGLPPDVAWPDPLMEQVHELQVGRDACLGRGERLVLQGKTGEGLALLREVVRRYPDSDRAQLFLGRACLRLGDRPATESALREAVRLAADNVEAHFLLGTVLSVRKEHRPAAECFRRATEIRPDHALAHYNRAQCLLAGGDREGAIDSLRAALRYMPNLAEAHATLGELLAREGHDAEALDHLRHAVRLDPADARARQALKEVRARLADRPTP